MKLGANIILGSKPTPNKICDARMPQWPQNNHPLRSAGHLLTIPLPANRFTMSAGTCRVAA
jgi:hypothetical protein